MEFYGNLPIKRKDAKNTKISLRFNLR